MKYLVHTKISNKKPADYIHVKLIIFRVRGIIRNRTFYNAKRNIRLQEDKRKYTLWYHGLNLWDAHIIHIRMIEIKSCFCFQSDFLPLYTLRGADNGSSPWVHAIYLEDPNGIPISWLYLGTALVVAGIWGVD